MKEQFLRHLAPVSGQPSMLEVDRAEGHYIIGKDGKKYLDLISGIGVNPLGHRHPEIMKAIEKQASDHLHVMVYGEFVQRPQVQFARTLSDHLPSFLDCVYFVNSGTEAVEGSLKLVKRLTGRGKIVACRNAYHGSTQGALSVTGGEHLKRAFRPLLPGVSFMEFNTLQDLELIDRETAAVIVEVIQGDGGVIEANREFLEALRNKCDQNGVCLIFDEIQTGLGRTGKMFGFQHYEVKPDVLLLGKALGGGLPLAAFISSHKKMQVLKEEPVLGHITTFGGNPLACAAGNRLFELLLQPGLLEQVEESGRLFREKLDHPKIRVIRGKGLLLAIDLGQPGRVKAIYRQCFQHGIITGDFIFNDQSIRLAPPLTITSEEIGRVCTIIREALDKSGE